MKPLKSISKASTQFFAKRNTVNFGCAGIWSFLSASHMSTFIVADSLMAGAASAASGLCAVTYYYASKSRVFVDLNVDGNTYRLNTHQSNKFQKLSRKIDVLTVRLKNGDTFEPEKIQNKIDRLDQKRRWIIEGRLKSEISNRRSKKQLNN